MKKTYFINMFTTIGIFLITHAISFGQNDSNFISSKETNRVKIRNKKNTLYDKEMVVPNLYANLSTIRYEDSLSINKAFIDAIPVSRIKEIDQEVKFVVLRFFIDTKGTVKEIDFTLPKDVKISNKELEMLEKSLKNIVKFKFITKSFEGANFITFMQKVRLSRILNNQPIYEKI